MNIKPKISFVLGCVVVGLFIAALVEVESIPWQLWVAVCIIFVIFLGWCVQKCRETLQVVAGDAGANTGIVDNPQSGDYGDGLHFKF